MAHWLLQHNPAKAGVCGLLRPGHNRGGWSIRRYRDRMAVGDDVAVWVSGSRGGVVALGCVVGEPRTGPDGVTVEVDLPRLFLDEAIRRDDLRADERFADALVLRMPGGSNPFPLTPPQWQATRPARDRRIPTQAPARAPAGRARDRRIPTRARAGRARACGVPTSAPARRPCSAVRRARDRRIPTRARGRRAPARRAAPVGRQDGAHRGCARRGRGDRDPGGRTLGGPLRSAAG
jgi:hypothetical protein